MSKHAALYVAVFSTLAIFIGWNFRTYKGAASELTTRINQVPLLKDARDRAFGTVALLAVVFAIVLYVIATRHQHG